MVKNCPNCKLRSKADPDVWDTNGGDFWYCSAEIIWPVFVQQMTGAQYAKFNKQVNRLINLNLFNEGTTYHEGLQKDCPLFEKSV